MHPRQLGYLASRLFAIYLLFLSLPYYISILTRFMVTRALTGNDTPPVFIVHLVAFPVIACVTAFLFWNKANWIASSLARGLPKSDVDIAQSIQWERLGLMVVGAFALGDCVVEIGRLLAEIVAYIPDSFGTLSADHQQNMLTYGFHAIASLMVGFPLLIWPQSLLGAIKALRGLASAAASEVSDSAD